MVLWRGGFHGNNTSHLCSALRWGRTHPGVRDGEEERGKEEEKNERSERYVEDIMSGKMWWKVSLV